MIKHSLEAIVLAAGSSRRFGTNQTKQLSIICGQPMVIFSLKVLQELNVSSALIIGPQSEDIRREVVNHKLENIAYFLQQEPLGTAHAVSCAKHWWTKDYVLVLSADVPLITASLIEKMFAQHITSGATVSFLTSYVLEPHGFGRVIEGDGRVSIIEDRECSDAQRGVNRVNVGIYLINRSFLSQHIDDVLSHKKEREVSITEIIKRATAQGKHVEAITVPYDSVRGVNTIEDLWVVQQIKRSDIIRYWMSRGVRFELAQNIHIDMSVSIGEGSFIGTGVHLIGKTKIGRNCRVNAFSIIETTELGDGSTVHSHSVIQHSIIGKNVHVGPFARLHSHVQVDDNAIVGNFVEVKNSSIGESTKIKHLAYVGDAFIGKASNIGAGTIICNYDGARKHHTHIGNNVFIGSNNTLVAPLKIGDGAFTAAGSTITDHVNEQAFAIARARQEIKEGYAERLRGFKSSDKIEQEFSFSSASAPSTRELS